MSIRLASLVGLAILLFGIITGSYAISMCLMFICYVLLILIIRSWSLYLTNKLKIVLSGTDYTKSHYWLKFSEGQQIEKQIGELYKKVQISQLSLLDQKVRHAGENLDLMLSSTTDPLTGAANRREMENYLDRIIAREKIVSVIMTDIDHFKKINDTYGHDVGDMVLKEFAKTIKYSVRPQDYLCRYGGEEFLVICVAGIEEALSIAERIRIAVATTPIKTISNQIISITASFGVAQYKPGESNEEFIKRADTGLYEAKKNGRNRVERGV